MQKNNNTIFLVTGGTGGHFFPALAVAQKDKKNKYIFVIDKRVEENLKTTVNPIKTLTPRFIQKALKKSK